VDPSVIAALSGAPASLVLAYFIIAQQRDRKMERRDYLRSMAADRHAIEGLSITIQRQSALLLTAVEYIAPGRGEAIQRRVTELFQQPTAPPYDHEQGEDS
jgi:hypothetical protein